MSLVGTRPPTVDEWEKNEEMEMDYRKEYERWMKQAAMDEDIVEELRSMDDAKMEDAFYRDLAFGTGGLRGVIGAGTNRINIYTIPEWFP